MNGGDSFIPNAAPAQAFAQELHWETASRDIASFILDGMHL
jgi:hypothetical protein